MKNLTTLTFKPDHPIQTQEWGEFRKSAGNEILSTRYGLLTLHKIPFLPFRLAMFLKGPKPTEKMLADLKKLGKEKGLIFIKLEPNYVSPNEPTKNKLSKLLYKNGCVPGKTLFTPSTFWVDLTKSEEELLKSFHPKTRYNIRLAQKNGVEVVEDNSTKAFEKYISLTRETVMRQGFYAHNEKYHRLMWKHLHQSPITNHQPPIAHLLTARYKGKIITTWIVFSWKDSLYYPYGASTEEHKKVMANNLICGRQYALENPLVLKLSTSGGGRKAKGLPNLKKVITPEWLSFWEVGT